MMAAQKAEAEAAREAKKAHDAMVASLQAAEKGTFRQTNARLVEMKQHLEGVDQSFSDVVATGMPKFTQALVGLQPTVKQNMETLGDEGGGSFMSGIFEKLTGGGTEGGLSGMMDRLGIGGGKSLITGFMNQMTGQGEGGGGLMDRLGNLMQTIQGGWQAAVTAGLNMVPVVGPLMATFGPALMKGINGLAKKVWGGIKRLFGGPSAADLQAREMFDALGNAAHDTLGDMRSYQREYNDAISKGWDEQNAKARAAFMVRGEIEGKSRAESFRDYERFQNAMESENHDTLESMTDNWNQWYLDWSTGQSSQVTTSSTTTDALVADSQRQGEAFESTADRGTSGFDQMQQSMSNSFSQIGAQAKSVAAQVNAALGSIKTNITVKINYVQTGAVPEGARGAGGGGGGGGAGGGGAGAGGGAGKEPVYRGGGGGGGVYAKSPSYGKKASEIRKERDLAWKRMAAVPYNDPFRKTMQWRSWQTAYQQLGREYLLALRERRYQVGTREGGSYGYGQFGGGSPAILHGREAVVPQSGVGSLAADIAKALSRSPLNVNVVGGWQGSDSMRPGDVSEMLAERGLDAFA